MGTSDRQALCNAIVQQLQQITRRARHLCREPRDSRVFDLSMAQLKALLFLEEGPAHMSRIASALQVSLPSATGTIDRLVERGLVERHEDPADRRLVVCALTAEGEAEAASIYDYNRVAVERLLSGVADTDLEIILQAFSILANAEPAGEGVERQQETASVPLGGRVQGEETADGNS